MRIFLIVTTAFFCLTPVNAAERYFTTLNQVHVAGFQGWFSCPSDGTGAGWSHWYRGGSDISKSSSLAIDNWPDMSELDDAEKCSTSYQTGSGEPIFLYSNANPKTVDRQVRWLAEYGIDGLAVQRFGSGLQDPGPNRFFRRVLRNIQTSSEKHKRGFFVMYDGIKPETVDLIEADWKRLKSEAITSSPSYVFHHGKPVVGLWGLGFKERPMSVDQSRDLISFFKSEGVTLLGGVPSRWRTLTSDSRSEPEWSAIYRSFDIISPWSVGRFVDQAGVNAYTNSVTLPDLAETKRLGLGYMPVVFPGFSWHNGRAAQNANQVDALPRRCGTFYRHQIGYAIRSGANMLYSAMFDEIQEGTAIFKLSTNASNSPTGIDLVYLGKDQCQATSDMYLRIAGQATEMLRSTSRANKDLR